MYGIFTYIYILLILVVNVGKYTIHGWYVIFCRTPLNDEVAPLQQTWETWARDSLCFRWGGWNATVFNNGIMKLPCMGRPWTEGWLQKASSKTTICLVSEFMTSFHPVRQQKPFARFHFGTGFCWDALVANRSKLKERYVVLCRTKKLFLCTYVEFETWKLR